MLLAIDIGNTNIEFGVFNDEKLISFRLGTKRDITSDEVGLLTSQFFMIHNIDRHAVKDVIITSVVPEVNYSVSNSIKKYFQKTPYIVGENIPINFKNIYDNPKEVGSDRLVNAIAAFSKYGGPLIVVDFGTATTFDAISTDGAYMGGAIYPGIKISMEALFQKASKLPRIQLVNPAAVIGTNTVKSMQVGAYYGYVGAVTNITNEMRKQLGCNVKIIGTGGLSGLIGKETGIFHSIDKSLTLEGLKLIYNEYIDNNR